MVAPDPQGSALTNVDDPQGSVLPSGEAAGEDFDVDPQGFALADDDAAGAAPHGPALTNDGAAGAAPHGPALADDGAAGEAFDVVPASVVAAGRGPCPQAKSDISMKFFVVTLPNSASNL